jgi:hypothetical protein
LRYALEKLAPGVRADYLQRKAHSANLTVPRV